MTMSSLSSRMLFICTLVGLLITGCSETGQPQSDKPDNPTANVTTQGADGELVIAAGEHLPAYDPFGVSKREPALHDTELLTYRGLFTGSPETGLQPALATGYQVDRTKAKPIVTVTLRKDARWADGQPVTVDDVVFSYQEYARPFYYGVWRKWSYLLDGISAYRTGKAKTITGISVDHKQNVIRFTLTRDDHLFLQGLTAPVLPKHQLVGKSISEIDTLSKSGKLLGAGPFQMERMQADSWLLRANPEFYAGAPRLERVRIIALPQSQVEPEIKAGRIHLSWLSPEQADSMNSLHQGKIVAARAKGFHFLGFNLQSKAVADQTIREALGHALASEQFAALPAFHGWAVPVMSPLAPDSSAYAQGKWPAYQPQQAKRMLEQKGYNATQPLTLTLVYPAQNRVREALVSEIEKAWQDLPIRIKKKALAPDEYVSYVFGGSPLDLYLYAWEYPDDPAELREIWHSREKVGELGLNASRYENPEADRLLDEAGRLIEQKQQTALFHKWQQQFAKDMPILPLLALNTPYFVSSRLQGVPEKLGIHPFANIYEWSLQPE